MFMDHFLHHLLIDKVFPISPSLIFEMDFKLDLHILSHTAFPFYFGNLIYFPSFDLFFLCDFA
jgi:hypothetical protein